MQMAFLSVSYAKKGVIQQRASHNMSLKYPAHISVYMYINISFLYMATAQGLLCSITTHQKKREKQKKILTDSSHARSGACGGGVQGEFGVRMRTALEILLHTLSSSG